MKPLNFKIQLSIAFLDSQFSIYFYSTMTQTLIYTLLEILKYTLPALVVLFATYMIVNKFLTTEFQRKQLAIFQDNIKITIPMRMQAYERLILFVERMNVHNLANRFYVANSSATELQIAMTDSIRTEWEYNLSQQLYVSNEVWQTINTAKEQEIGMINNIASNLPANASAKDLVTALAEHNIKQEDDTPAQIALQSINGEAKKALMAG